jgi:hypothetical protein
MTETMATDVTFSEFVVNYVSWKDNLMFLQQGDLILIHLIQESCVANDLGNISAFALRERTSDTRRREEAGRINFRTNTDFYPAVQLLYDWRFTANEFVLAPSPFRLMNRDFFTN